MNGISIYGLRDAPRGRPSANARSIFARRLSASGTSRAIPLAVTRDDDALTAFNLIEEAWQVRLGLRCLNFAHDYTIDQSN
jgi:hypothetical protein